MDDEAGNSFSRSLRLTVASDYSRVFKKNFRIADDCMTLLVNVSGREQPRLGFAVAKKQIRRAVDRNRIKRLMRESFRLNRQRLPATDIVFMVRPGILRLSHSQIFARLDSHWQKIISKCAN